MEKKSLNDRDINEYLYFLSTLDMSKDEINRVHIEYSSFVNEIFGIIIDKEIDNYMDDVVKDMFNFRQYMYKKYAFGSSEGNEHQLELDDIKNVRRMTKEERYAAYLENNGLV